MCLWIQSPVGTRYRKPHLRTHTHYALLFPIGESPFALCWCDAFPPPSPSSLYLPLSPVLTSLLFHLVTLRNARARWRAVDPLVRRAHPYCGALPEISERRSTRGRFHSLLLSTQSLLLFTYLLTPLNGCNSVYRFDRLHAWGKII